MARRHMEAPRSCLGDGGVSNQQQRFVTPPPQHRQILARVPLGDDELVLSLDHQNRLDVRVWTATAGVRMASGNGLTIALTYLPHLLDALEQVLKREGA
jgi:hypothetical protein